MLPGQKPTRIGPVRAQADALRSNGPRVQKDVFSTGRPVRLQRGQRRHHRQQGQLKFFIKITLTF